MRAAPRLGDAGKGDASAALAREGYAERRYRLGDDDQPVWDKGLGPPVLVLHELPGLTWPCVAFAERLVDAGFHVHLPLLFGQALASQPWRNWRRLCIARTFAGLQAGQHAPATDEPRVLAQDIGLRSGGRRVGVIGMCVTGAYVIPLVVDAAVGAAVASQPAVPLRLSYWLAGAGRGPWMTQLNIADAELQQAAQVCARDRKRVLVQRFEDDRLCPPERLQRIVGALGDAADEEQYPAPAGWRRWVHPPHALLTSEFKESAGPTHPAQQALQRVVAFLRQELNPGE